jgi:catechol 2,3-dioxygenase-like lactoylglutathione lyase family enzyme
MFKLHALDHVALSVRDVNESARWYGEVLGFKRQHDGLWNGVPVFVGTGELAIALFPIRGDSAGESSAPGRTRILHFAMRTDRQNFMAAQAALKDRGLEFEFQDHEISHSIYFRDPDNHEIEITTYELR